MNTQSFIGRISLFVALCIFLIPTQGYSFFFDKKMYLTGSVIDEVYLPFQVDSTTSEIVSLYQYSMALSNVKLSSEKFGSNCNVSVDEYPRALIHVKNKMDLRIYTFGEQYANIVVSKSSGETICSEIAKGWKPGEIVLKNIEPGIYQVRVGFENPVGDPKRLAEMMPDNELYIGEHILLFAENISGRNQGDFNSKFSDQELQKLHEKAKVDSRNSFKLAVKKEYTKELEKLKAERKESQKFWAELGTALIETAPVVIQAMNNVALEEQKRAYQQAEMITLNSQQNKNLSEAKQSQLAVQSSAASANKPNSNKQLPDTSKVSSNSSKQSNSGIPSKAQKVTKNITWPEALVICPKPANNKSLSAASNCYGPMGSVFVDRVADDINMDEIERGCDGGSPREIGWIENYRVFGCNVGINPTKSSISGHLDPSKRFGISISNRKSYQCPASQYEKCNN